MSPRARIAASWTVALVAGLGAAAATADTSFADGYFESPSLRLGVRDAYAFVGISSLGEPGVVLVAVSNAGFEQDQIDEYFDRRWVIDNYFQDEDTEVVWLEFDSDGHYRGLSYYFGTGDGCGYCSGGVESSVHRAGDRLVGSVRQGDAGDGRHFEITLDVPVSADDHGVAQGEGGGAPGRAYAAYDRALADRAAARVRELVTAERRATWAGAEAAGDGDRFFQFLIDEHPRRAKVTTAYVRGDRALVLFEGDSSEGSIRGEALLALEDGAWRFEEETLQPREP
jgi:hypothetical protein